MEDISTINLKGKYVILKDSVLAAPYNADPTWQVFEAQEGFGCTPGLSGTAVFGQFVRDGDRARFERFHVERLATDDEVAAARAAGEVS